MHAARGAQRAIESCTEAQLLPPTLEAVPAKHKTLLVPSQQRTASCLHGTATTPGRTTTESRTMRRRIAHRTPRLRAFHCCHIHLQDAKERRAFQRLPAGSAETKVAHAKAPPEKRTYRTRGVRTCSTDRVVGQDIAATCVRESGDHCMLSRGRAPMRTLGNRRDSVLSSTPLHHRAHTVGPAAPLLAATS